MIMMIMLKMMSRKEAMKKIAFFLICCRGIIQHDCKKDRWSPSPYRNFDQNAVMTMSVSHRTRMQQCNQKPASKCYHASSLSLGNCRSNGPH